MVARRKTTAQRSGLYVRVARVRPKQALRPTAAHFVVQSYSAQRRPLRLSFLVLAHSAPSPPTPLPRRGEGRNARFAHLANDRAFLWTAIQPIAMFAPRSVMDSSA